MKKSPQMEVLRQQIRLLEEQCRALIQERDTAEDYCRMYAEYANGIARVEEAEKFRDAARLRIQENTESILRIVNGRPKERAKLRRLTETEGR